MVRSRYLRGRHHTVAKGRAIPLGSATVAPAASFHCDQSWAVDRQIYSVIWRRYPPVLSPVSTRALVDGMGAAIGLRRGSHAAVTAILRHRYGATDALLTDSGTSALILALRKMLPRGGTVAYPAYACIDLTAAAVATGVRVRLYDLDPTTMSPDLDSVRATVIRLSLIHI